MSQNVFEQSAEIDSGQQQFVWLLRLLALYYQLKNVLFNTHDKHTEYIMLTAVFSGSMGLYPY